MGDCCISCLGCEPASQALKCDNCTLFNYSFVSERLIRYLYFCKLYLFIFLIKFIAAPFHTNVEFRNHENSAEIHPNQVIFCLIIIIKRLISKVSHSSLERTSKGSIACKRIWLSSKTQHTDKFSTLITSWTSEDFWKKWWD